MSSPHSDIEVLTFGCRLNRLESAAIRRAADTAGRDNLVIVNTCAVTGEAVRQARQTIRRLRRQRPEAEIVVTGCAAQTETGTFAAMPEITRVVGNDLKTRPDTWRPAGAHAERVQVTDMMTATTAAHPVESIEGRTRGFVQVQTGCDHRCTFCVIPFGRGNSRSVPLPEVISSVDRLVGAGIREVVLTGVDITSWGLDLDDAPRLGHLVRSVLRSVPDLERLRLSSIDSIEVDAELMEAIGSETRLMPHLHLSLQAGDDLILKRMKRRHLRADAIRFCQQLRRIRPDIVFGADIIAGFPTESEDMFSRSLDLVEDCGLTFLHVFPFSARPGTPAARMPPVAPSLVRERAARLRAVGEAALESHLARQAGRRLRVLAEAGGLGRAEDFTSVILPPGPAPGAVFEALVTGRHDGRLTVAAPLGLGEAVASRYRAGA